MHVSRWITLAVLLPEMSHDPTSSSELRKLRSRCPPKERLSAVPASQPPRSGSRLWGSVVELSDACFAVVNISLAVRPNLAKAARTSCDFEPDAGRVSA